MNDLRLPINEAREVPLSQILDIALLDGELVVHAVNSVTFSLPAQPTPEFGWRASSI